MTPLQYSQFQVFQIGQEEALVDDGSWLGYHDLLEMEEESTGHGLSEEKTAKLCRVVLGEHDDRECAVCHDEFREHELLVRLPCDHIFHTACILKWMEAHTTCPLCRFDCDACDS
eukprot:TRINITY_DN973_c0_g1_i1.p2 TRINITY_DN973_c0_g1~~TRINITY_DN973_c0_g1_i1.p2  ORF type:complete len:115 (+),score=26.84 TRINITY_DN973_c0_g1_i1:466-810(+)